MRSWWRLLALALALSAVFSFTVYPADAGISGIFDNRASFGDLDHDFDEMLRRLRPPAATDTSAAVLDASASPILRLSLVLTAAEPLSWTGPPPTDRGPPGGHTRQQIGPSPSLTGFQSAFPAHISRAAPSRRQPDSSPLAHGLRRERTITWPR